MSNERQVPNPDKDGIDHVNIYSRGKTELGRLLSNFAYLPFEHPKYGWFNSIEGLWYWLKTGKMYEFLRTASGYSAKNAGKQLPSIYCRTFKEDICLGIQQKIAVSERLQVLLYENTLPFEHYYVYGEEGNQTVREPDRDGVEWMINCILEVQAKIKNNETIAIPMVDIGRRPNR